MLKKENLIGIKRMWLPILLALLINTFTYNVSRLWTTGRFHYNLTTSFDASIPVVSWTVIIYLGCYATWIINYALACRQKMETACRFYCADFFAKVICFVIFMIMPSTLERPEITGTGIWDEVLRFVYSVDPPDNLFPSVHCLTSTFCVLAVRHNRYVNTWYRVFSVVVAIAVYASTLTTKQHVVIDVFAGVILAEFSYWFVHKVGLDKCYCSFILKCTKKRK